MVDPFMKLRSPPEICGVGLDGTTPFRMSMGLEGWGGGAGGGGGWVG